MSRLVVVGKYTNSIEANLAAGKLRAEGIAAMLAGEEVVSAFSGLMSLGSTIALQVKEEDCERAMALLIDIDPEAEKLWNDPDEDDDDVWVCSLCGGAVKPRLHVCPSCGTARDSLRTNMESRATSVAIESTQGDRIRAADAASDPPPAEAPAEEEVVVPALGAALIDDTASRALRASLLGLLIPLVSLYSLWLLFSLMRHSGELSDRAMYQCYWALGVNVLVVFVISPIYLRYFGALAALTGS
jgi:hypothetical protein